MGTSGSSDSLSDETAPKEISLGFACINCFERGEGVLDDRGYLWNVPDVPSLWNCITPFIATSTTEDTGVGGGVVGAADFLLSVVQFTMCEIVVVGCEAQDADTKLGRSNHQWVPHVISI